MVVDGGTVGWLVGGPQWADPEIPPAGGGVTPWAWWATRRVGDKMACRGRQINARRRFRACGIDQYNFVCVNIALAVAYARR